MSELDMNVASAWNILCACAMKIQEEAGAQEKHTDK